MTEVLVLVFSFGLMPRRYRAKGLMASDATLVEQVIGLLKCPSLKFLSGTAAPLNKFPLTKRRKMNLLSPQFIGNTKSLKAGICKGKTEVSMEAEDGSQFITNGLPNAFFSIKF